jgi:hypothetical protein
MQFPIVVTVTNLGHALASDVKMHCAPVHDQRNIKYSAFEATCYGKLQPLGPGRSYQQRFTLLMSQREYQTYKQGNSGIIIYGVLQYRDDVTRARREEPWCYQSPAYLRKDTAAPEFLPCSDRVMYQP